MPSSKSDESHPVRMLVLETDEPHPDTKNNEGSFGDIFTSLFKEAGVEHDPPLEIQTEMHYVVDDPENGHHGHVPDVSEVDPSITAILITGSMYDAHGSDRWILELKDLLEKLWKDRLEMKFSGVCFGHQILCRVLGATVESTPGGKWELAHTEMKLTSIGQELFRTKDKTLSLHQMHQDQVTKLPDASQTDLLPSGTKVGVWASTERTPVQGIYIPDKVFTSQGHLGFDEKMVRRQIQMRQDSGGIEDHDQAAEAKETAHMRHDGLVVASAILRFFHGEDKNVG